MKKLYIRTIIGSSGSDCLLISTSWLIFLNMINSGWVSMTRHLNIGRRTNPVLILLKICKRSILKVSKGKKNPKY